MQSVIEHGPLAASGHPRPTLGPAGAWADLPAFVSPGRPSSDQLESGRCIWLNDSQIDLTGPERRWLTRTINEVATLDGLTVGQVGVDFDPAFERVVFHHVYILRDGVTRSYNPLPAMQVIQRERDLERARFDGRLTAHFVIPDLRVGDIVDIAWTLVGGHPLLASHFGAEWVFDWGCWVGATRVRLLTPDSRTFRFMTWGRPPAMQERRLDDGILERIWLSRETAAVQREADTPVWVRTLSTVACAEAISWPEVASLFRPLYRLEAPLPAELEAEVARIEAAEPGPDAKVVAALRLVQGSLRYQAVTMGAGGFTPNPVASIWSTRSGDCKDASLLLTLVLRRLGVEACPALVHTAFGWGLAEGLPALAAFDHCIVRVRLDGRTYWLDPTNFPQGGRLATLVQPSWGWALPLTEGADLESMGEPEVSDLGSVEEEIVFGPTPTAPAKLTVRTVNRSGRADWNRRRLAAAQAATEEQFRDFYAKRYGGAATLAPMTVEDDLAANVLITVEQYEIARPWEAMTDGGVRFATRDDILAPNLATPRTPERRYPIDLGTPRTMAHDIILRLGRSIRVTGWNDTFTAAGVTMASIHQVLDEPGDSRLRLNLTIARRIVDAAEAEAFFDARDKAAGGSGVILTMAVEDGRFVAPNEAPVSKPVNTDGSGVNWWWLIIGGFFAISAVARSCTPT